jgi:hypothetical protein
LLVASTHRRVFPQALKLKGPGAMKHTESIVYGREAVGQPLTPVIRAMLVSLVLEMRLEAFEELLGT